MPLEGVGLALLRLAGTPSKASSPEDCLQARHSWNGREEPEWVEQQAPIPLKGGPGRAPRSWQQWVQVSSARLARQIDRRPHSFADSRPRTQQKPRPNLRLPARWKFSSLPFLAPCPASYLVPLQTSTLPSLPIVVRFCLT